MNRLFASIVLLTLAACGGSKSTAAHGPGGGDTAGGSANDPGVDPTVPSWLPAACIAYHKAVVQAIDCQAVEQAKRDAIKNKYDETSTGWKSEENADKARVEEIGASCKAATESVRADIADKCV